MATYTYKPAEQGIVDKLEALPDYDAAFDAGMNYVTQGALSVDAFKRYNKERKERKEFGGTITYKVARCGGISAYGLQRWPVTLYVEQWEALLTGAPPTNPLLAFIATNPTTEHKATPAKGDKPALPAVTATIKRKGATTPAASTTSAA